VRVALARAVILTVSFFMLTHEQIQRSCVSLLSSPQVEGTVPLLICSEEMSQFAEEVSREYSMYTEVSDVEFF